MSQAIVETADKRVAMSSNELIERVAKEATQRFGRCYIRSRSLDNGKIQWWVDKRGRIAFAAQSLEELSKMISDGSPPAANGISGKNYSLVSAQAAGILGVSKHSMYWFISQRGLPHLKVYGKNSQQRGRVLFDKDELLDWMRSNTVKPAMKQRGVRKPKRTKHRVARAAHPEKVAHHGGVEARLNDLVLRMSTLLAMSVEDAKIWKAHFIENAIKRALDIAEGR